MPKLKSDSEPEFNEEAVKVVVGSSHARIVKEKTKDVLMHYYATACRECKKLEPVWEELAKHLVYIGATEVVVGKMDTTTNEAEGVGEVS